MEVEKEYREMSFALSRRTSRGLRFFAVEVALASAPPQRWLHPRFGLWLACLFSRLELELQTHHHNSYPTFEHNPL